MRTTVKKLAVCVAMALSSACLVSPASATFIEFGAIDLEGFVNPVDATVVDNGNGTSTFGNLTYTLETVATNNSEVWYVQVGFESDIFDLSSYSLDATDPSNWSPIPIPPVGDFTYLGFAAGTMLDEGDDFAFTLDDVIIQNAALTDPGFWNEGQIWAQPWAAFGTNFAVDGGSTAPVPEPGTMVLLGSGLLGMVAWGRRRMQTV